MAWPFGVQDQNPSRTQCGMSFIGINKTMPKIGASELARGSKLFCDDIKIEDCLFLSVKRSERPHAKLISVDWDEALKLPGVLGVLCHEHVPGELLYGLISKDQPLLAKERVRFVGEAIALVVAESEEAAERAVDKIRVKYEDLPAVFDPEEALKEGAPALHASGNLLHRRRIRRGDVEQALSQSHIVIRRTYTTSHLEHSYLEPDAGVGYVDEEGCYVIYASTQNPHYDQAEVARILGMEKDRVRIIQAATGGGFGSKLDLNVQGYIALALYHFRRPVRITYSRDEAFLATPKRHPLKMELETGADKTGRITALRARIICDTGAYASYGMAVATRAAVHVTGPYCIDNVDVESLAVYTNNPVAGAMRGFGAPQAAFAYESQMDLIARELGIDPLEIRKINAFRKGSTTATGQVLEASVGILETISAVERHYEDAKKTWAANGGGLRRGIGIGSMWYGIGNTASKNPSQAKIEFKPDEGIILYTGAADIGQGSTTVLTQIAAEALGVEPTSIKTVYADTRFTENAGATSASRQTYISGNAVKEAAEKLALGLLEEAQLMMGCPPEDLQLDHGVIRNVKTGDTIQIREVAAHAMARGRALICEGHFDPKTTMLDPETGQGIPYATYAFATHIALVEVDEGTGEVFVRKIVAAHDVGRAIHPQNVEGQIHGGMAMGVGFALMEEYIVGQTKSMADYHIPTSMDMPEIISIIVEDEEPTGPYGAKGVGEPSLIPTAPAIMNAIANALGKRAYRLPAKPEHIRKIVKEG